jgi:YaiO family outer membrane protein
MLEGERTGRALLCSIALCAMADASAQEAPPYSLDISAERARLHWAARDADWWTGRVQLSARRLDAGWYAAAESQRRDRDTETALEAGMYGRAGRWNWSGQVTASPGADFLPRFSLQPQVGLRFGTSVVQAGYIYKSFAESRLHLGTLGLTTYVGDSEFEIRLTSGRSQPLGRRIQVTTVRGAIDRGGPWTFGLSASAGRGLYDILNIPGVDGNRGWSAGANARYRIDATTSVRLDLGVGHEHPDFRERRIGISLRKSF